MSNCELFNSVASCIYFAGILSTLNTILMAYILIVLSVTPIDFVVLAILMVFTVSVDVFVAMFDYWFQTTCIE